MYKHVRVTDHDGRDFTIDSIQALTEVEAAMIARDHMKIKGHDVYFVDFNGYFGYSCLVFAEGQHIYFANDYQLHHNKATRSECRKQFIKSLHNKLFTEEELRQPSLTYDEQERKNYFLHNYYSMRRPHKSAFEIIRNEEDKKKYNRERKGMIYCPPAFAYYNDQAFVDHMRDLFTARVKAEDHSNDYEYNKKAFMFELANHEYQFNHYQGDYDTLSAFGRLEWLGEDAPIDGYFDQLDFTDTQRRAYKDAVREFLATCEY